MPRDKKDKKKEPEVSPIILQFITNAETNHKRASALPTSMDGIPNVQVHEIAPRKRSETLCIPWHDAEDAKLTVISGSVVRKSEAAGIWLPKVDFIGGIFDVVYDMGTARPDREFPSTTKEDFEAFMECWKQSNTSEYWTVVVFVGHKQLESFHELLQVFCNCGVERHFWLKSNQQPGVQQEIATSAVECFLVGFWSKDGYKNTVQKQFKNGYNYVNHPVVRVPYHYERKVR
jgi:hypothetical protein